MSSEPKEKPPKNPRRVLARRRRSVVVQRGRVIAAVVVTALALATALAGRALAWSPWIVYPAYFFVAFGVFAFVMDLDLYRKQVRAVADEARAVEAGENPYTRPPE